MKPANPKCVILCPKCAKIHLKASGGQKILTPIKEKRGGVKKGRERRGGEERGGEGGRGGEGRREGLAHSIILI
jgi:hypothetical protein